MKQKSSKYVQGAFKPSQPQKYVGNTANIIYRSWLEFRAMHKLDHDPNIIKWASEEFFIPYKHPIDGIMHRYFVDLFFEKRERNGKQQKYICEVKPQSQTKPPINRGKSKMKRYITESATFAINSAKWASAIEWAKRRDCKFIIWTEKDL